MPQSQRKRIDEIVPARAAVATQAYTSVSIGNLVPLLERTVHFEPLKAMPNCLSLMKNLIAISVRHLIENAASLKNGSWTEDAIERYIDMLISYGDATVFDVIAFHNEVLSMKYGPFYDGLSPDKLMLYWRHGTGVSEGYWIRRTREIYQ